jgi:hypothetical protein
MDFRSVLQDAFAYPFRENGVMVLVWGTILGIFMSLAGFAPIIGFIAILILSAYFCAVFFDIIMTTSSGSDDCVGFPSASDFFEDLILPYLKVVLAVIVSVIPALVIAYFLGGILPEFIILLLPGLFVAIYFPMAILAMVILGTFGAVSPHIVLPAIASVGRLYWFIVGLLVLTFILVIILELLTQNIFILGSIFSSFLAMLSLMINGRLIGLLYRHREEELDWV